MFKRNAILALYFVFYSCHNNAHLRTQKVLKKDESVFSASSVLPLGGVDKDYRLDTENGIVALRGELSYLRGFGDFELGPYLGIGFSEGTAGTIAGFDYKKYLNTKLTNPAKFGAQVEMNFSNLGSVLHIKPSIITTTTEYNPYYLGIHGLFYRGRINERVEYNYSSLGFGLTLGSEFIYSRSSFQAQIDVSFANNRFDIITDSPYDYYYYDEEYADPGDNFYLLFGLSAGVSFFNSPGLSLDPLIPMPAPSAYISSPKQVLYDPNTGEIKKDKIIKYDPESGEIITDSTIEYNPDTGEKKINKEIQNDLDKGEEGLLTDFDVRKLAHINSRMHYVNPSWSFIGGISGIGLGFGGLITGGIFSFEILDLNSSEGLLGPIIGGVVGLTIPFSIAGKTKINFNYPSNVTSSEQKILYKDIYRKNIIQKRSRLISNGYIGCGIVGIMGMVMLATSL